MKIVDAAIQLNKSEETVRRYIRNGVLKATIKSRKHGYDISQDEIDRFKNKDLDTILKSIDIKIDNHKIEIEKHKQEIRNLKKVKEKLLERR